LPQKCDCNIGPRIEWAGPAVGIELKTKTVNMPDKKLAFRFVDV
jgi:hypothetical protein